MSQKIRLRKVIGDFWHEGKGIIKSDSEVYLALRKTLNWFEENHQ